MSEGKTKKWMLYIGLFLFLMIWQWNGLIINLVTGYDMGVQNMELMVSYDDSLHYGRALIIGFYPPLGWLYKGIVPALETSYGNAIFHSIMINMFSAALRTFIIALFWKNVSSTYSKVIAILSTILIFVVFPVKWGGAQLDLCILTVSMIICQIHIMLKADHEADNIKKTACNGKVTLLVILTGVLLSIPQLAKFSFFPMVPAMIIILSLILIFRKKYIDVGVLVLSYTISTFLLWILCGEKIQYIFSFFGAMLHCISGYSEIMALDFIEKRDYFPDFLLMVFLCIVYGIFLLYLIIRKKGFFATSWFVGAPYIFLCFKEVFVRSDSSHVDIYFLHSLFYILCYLMFALETMECQQDLTKKIDFKKNKLLWPMILLLLLIPQVLNNGWFPITTIYSDYRILGNIENYNKSIAESKAANKSNYVYQSLYNDVQNYPDATLGMLSGEQTFFATYDLLDRFILNPVISLWNSGTGFSEVAAASQYGGEHAPDILLYNPEPLDGGYYIFHMGTILEALLENYQVEKVNDYGYLILKHNSQKDNLGAYSLGGPKKVSIGETIEIPKVENAYVFMKVDWDLTPIGSLAKFILKPTENKVEITTDNGGRYSFRFLRMLAENGIYVSNYIDNSVQLAELFDGDIMNNSIDSIRFFGNKVFWENEIEVSFYAVPFTPENAQSKTFNIDFTNELRPGNYQIFYAQDYAFNEEKSKWISVGEGQNRITAFIPSDDWNTLRLDFPPVEGNMFDLTSASVENKEVSLNNVNDVQLTEEEGAMHIVSGSSDPYVVFDVE